MKKRIAQFGGIALDTAWVSRVRRLLAGGILGLAAMTGAIAGPAVSFSGFGISAGGGNTDGWLFETRQSIAVTALGFFDLGRDGLATSHAVGLWTAAGTLLTSTTVTPGDLLDGDFRYASIAPIVLGAGERFVIAAVTGDGDGIVGLVQGLVEDPAIDHINMLFGSGVGLNFPTSIQPGFEPATFGPNFQLQAIPEPGTLALLGLALATMGALRRRSKSA